MTAPCSIHFAAVLRILRYVQDTLHHGFLFSLLSWKSKKQAVVACSSVEDEYRALADTTSEIVWLRWLLGDMGTKLSAPSPLFCDNKSAIQIAHNDVFHERTKHIRGSLSRYTRRAVISSSP